MVQHQFDIALAFGCERLICLIRSLDPEVVALQHRAEQAGVLFNTISAPRDLSALVTAADDVVVLYEGLLADTVRARDLLEQGTGVFVQPVEVGLAAGFERIDINNASAGMVRVPGRLIDALVQLPPDCDVPSALTRIALQNGIALREVPAESRSAMNWQMVTSESDAFAIEQEWIAHRLGNARLVSPGRWVARLGVTVFGSSLLHAGNASRIIVAGMLATLALAVGTAWLGAAVGGFVLCAVAWILLCAATMLKRLESPLAQGGARPSFMLALDWLFDAVLVLLLHWAAPPLAGTSPLLSLAVPVTFVLLVRHCRQLRAMPGGATVSDRTVLSLVLATSAALGITEWAIALGSVILAGASIAVTRDRGS